MRPTFPGRGAGSPSVVDWLDEMIRRGIPLPPLSGGDGSNDPPTAPGTPPAAPGTPPATPPGAPPVPPAPAPPAAPATPPAAPPPAQPVAGITMTVDQYRAYLADQQELANLRSQEAARAQAAEAERLRLVAERDGAQAAIQQAQAARQAAEREAEARFNELQRQYHSERLTAAVATATAGVNWASPHAAQDGLEKLAKGLETASVGGQIVVREVGTHRPAAEVIAERLRTDAFAHLLAAGSRGGSGAQGGNVTPPPPSEPPPAPVARNLGEALLYRAMNPLANPNGGPAPRPVKLDPNVPVLTGRGLPTAQPFARRS